jgi:hypothetical protein
MSLNQKIQEFPKSESKFVNQKSFEYFQGVKPINFEFECLSDFDFDFDFQQLWEI